MKTIYFLRHAQKQSTGDSDLSPQGVEQAKQLGATLLDRPLSAVYVSPLQRTKDTFIAMQAGAPISLNLTPHLFPPHAISASKSALRLWEGVCHEAERAGEDMLKAALTQAPDDAQSIAKEAANATKAWINTLPEHSRTMVIHHSPFLELILLGCLNINIDQLQPCEGFRLFALDDGSLTYAHGVISHGIHTGPLIHEWKWNKKKQSHDGVQLYHDHLHWYHQTWPDWAGSASKTQRYPDFLEHGPAVTCPKDVEQAIKDKITKKEPR